jgi:Rrf2 family protein
LDISAKTEYACIAMLDLASQHQSGHPVRIREIAERHDVPPRFLVQILLQLKGAGLVASVRGAAGGYQLLIPPAEISLGRILHVIDGRGDDETQSSHASPDSPAVKVLQRAWKRLPPPNGNCSMALHWPICSNAPTPWANRCIIFSICDIECETTPGQMRSLLLLPRVGVMVQPPYQGRTFFRRLS